MSDVDRSAAMWDRRRVELARSSASARRRAALILVTSFAGAHFTSLLVRKLLLDAALPTTMAGVAALMLLAALLSFLIYQLLEALSGRSVLARAAVAAALCLVAATLIQVFDDFLFGTPAGLDNKDRRDAFVADVHYWLWFMLAGTGIYLAVSYSQDLRDRERRLASSMVSARDAQLLALRYQINPHFLFNTLNSVAALISNNRPAHAEEMVLTLSDFFRATLTVDPLADAKLANEFRMQADYLRIEQMRFQHRLEFEFTLPPQLDAALIPSMILQPLIENAVKHGVCPSPQTVRIELAAWAEDELLYLSVTNDLPIESRAMPGLDVGQSNVRARLAARFGEAAALKVEGSAQSYVVTLCMPLILGPP